MRNHTNELPYKCKSCNERFGKKEDLKSHQDTFHQIAKQFQCLVCKTSFAKKCVLKNHVKIHIGIKPFKCPYPGCGKSFVEKGNMKSHFRVHVFTILI